MGCDSYLVKLFALEASRNLGAICISYCNSQSFSKLHLDAGEQLKRQALAHEDELESVNATNLLKVETEINKHTSRNSLDEQD